MPVPSLPPFFTFRPDNFHIGGSVSTLMAAAVRWRTFGDSALEAASAMRSINDGGFEGSEGDRFRELVNGDFPSNLQVTGDAHVGVADAISRYATLLSERKAEMATLETTARGSHAAVNAAAANVNAAEAALAAAPDPATKSAAAAALATAVAEHQAALGVWEGNLATAQGIRTMLGTDAEAQAAIIDTQSRKAFKDNPKPWEAAWDAVSDWLNEHGDILSFIADALQIVGAIAMFICPVVGAVLLGIGVGLKGLLAAAGVVSWGEFAFDLATAGPLGLLGKAVKAGKLGTTAAKGLNKASSVSTKVLSSVKSAASSAASKAALKTAGGINRVGSEKLAKSFYRTVTRGDEVCFKLEPVDMATGNMVDFKTDVFIDGILPLVLDRNANTNHELGRALGPRWVSTMDIRLEICADEVLMLAPDGALLTFPPAPTDGSEVRADGRPWLLSYADGAYRVRNIAAGLTYSFRLFDFDGDSEDTASPGVKDESPSLGGSYVAAIIPSGSLAETIDAGMEVGLSSVIHHTGASIEYTWDVASGHMVRMRRSDDTILDLEWDKAVGRVAHVYVSNPSTHPDEDPLRLISYAYDAYGQLIRVINSNDGALQYHYDEHGRMDAWTDRNGVSYFYRFDELGRVHSQVGTGGMFPNIVYWADDEGDDAPEGGRLCVAIETAGEFKGDPLELGNSVVDEYFARLEELPLYKALVEGGLTAAGMTGRGRTSSRDDETWTVPVEWLHDDFLGDIRPTVYRSTPSGDVWRIVTANGAVEDTSYDTYHQKISVTNTAGATTSYTYDENGVLVETTDYQGLAQSIEAGNWGTPVRVIDVDGLQTELVVDEFGLVEAVTLPDGTTTQYTSEIRISGIVPSGTIYPDGTMETVQCDDAGRLVGMVDTTGRRANIERDVRGLPGKMLDHTGEATTCEYTVEGWPSRIVHPDGTTVTSSYDREGNRVQSVNELGATTRTRYTIFDEPSETTDASGATTRLEYNTQMQLVRLTNADNKVWSFKYGLDGALIEQTDYNGFTTVRSVSPDGQELLYETAAGKTYRTLFPDGRVKTIRDDWGTTTFRYNSTGKLTGLAGPDAAISFDFDKYGRLTKETSTLNSGESFSHSREYDSVGRGHRCGLRLPLGDEIVSNFGFGESGELDSAQYSFASSSWDVREKIAELQFGNDELGFRNRISGDSVIRSYSTDIRGRRVADSIGVLDSREPTGLRTVNSRVFGWREDNVLQSVIDRERGVTTYELDVLGRVTELQRQTEDHLRAAGDSVSLAWDKRNSTGAFGRVEQYGFSASGLLTSMNVPSAINSDLTGPLAVGSADDRCRRNSQDARIEFKGTLPIRVGRTSYSYDAAGRVVQTVTKRVGKKPLVRSFYYGTGEQPIGYESSDQPDCGYRYLYDPLGRRIAKERVDSETGEVLVRTIFSYVGNQLSAQQVVLNKLGNPKLGSAKAKFAQPEGEGKVWVSDPETGDLVGQIELVPAMPRRNTSLEGANEVQGVREAVFLFLVTDLAGAPMELVHAGSGDLVGFADQTLYGDRVWRGSARTPLLFAGQYLDEESGWAYNRFRYFDPHAGIYNSQDPLGVKPKVSSAQGYVGHPGFQVDIFGLDSHKLLRAEHVQELKGIKEQIGQRFDEVAADWNNGTFGFTEKQLRHIETGNYWASARHRGTQLHMEVFERLRANPIDGVVPTPQGVGGPDYLVRLSDGTEVWLDLTTQGQAAKHVSKYGLWPGLTPSDHIIAYESRSVSGAKSDFRMSVRRLT